MQGHVLLQATRQKIHLITCEAEEGVWGPDRGGLCSPSTLPEMWEKRDKGGETTMAEGRGEGAEVLLNGG